MAAAGAGPSALRNCSIAGESVSRQELRHLCVWIGSGQEQAVVAAVESTAEGSQSFYPGSWKIPPLSVPLFLPWPQELPPGFWV